MFDEENVRVNLLSGASVLMAQEVYDEHYCDFDETKHFCFNNIINSGMYFPQVMQFICVMIAICNGYTSFVEILLCNLLSSVLFTVVWFLLKLYKLPGINFISCFIVGNVFRYFLHIIAIAVVSLTVIGNWKVLVFCLIGGVIARPIAGYLSAKMSTVKYNDEVTIHVSKYRI